MIRGVRMGSPKIGVACVIFASVVLLLGCASDPEVETLNENGSGPNTQLVPVSSDPSGAQIKLNGQACGYTPAKIEVERTKSNNVLVLSKPGYESQSVTLTRTGNADSGGVHYGVLGALLDLSSGNSYKQSPEKVHALLVPNQQAARPSNPPPAAPKPPPPLVPPPPVQPGPDGLNAVP